MGNSHSSFRNIDLTTIAGITVDDENGKIKCNFAYGTLNPKHVRELLVYLALVNPQLGSNNSYGSVMMMITKSELTNNALLALLIAGRLTSVNVSHNNLGVHGLKAIGQALQHNQGLTELYMAGIQFEQNHEIEIEQFTIMLRTTKALQKLDVSYNSLCAPDITAIVQALKGNQVLQELNIASNLLIFKADAKSRADTDMSGVIAISNAIPTMGALTNLNIGNNGIGQLVETDDVELLKQHGWKQIEHQGQVLFTQDMRTGQKKVSLPIGVIALADAIKNNGALASLNMSNNMLATKASGKALAEMLSSNSVLKELDVSKNAQWPNGDFWSDADGPGFAGIELINAIKNHRALVSVNLLGNHVEIDQANVLARILRKHSTLKSLCGNKGTETELNMVSVPLLGDEDAIMLSPELLANGKVVVNIPNNGISERLRQKLEAISKAPTKVQRIALPLNKLVTLDGEKLRLNTIGNHPYVRYNGKSQTCYNGFSPVKSMPFGSSLKATVSQMDTDK